MAETNTPHDGGGDDDLQFDKATPAAAAPGEIGTPPAPTCAACKGPILGQYYEAGGQLICPACRGQIEGQLTAKAGRTGRLARATAFGLIAAALCAAAWWGIRTATGYDLGIVAVVVGLVVGGAVRAGSRGRGGAGYQVIAILLTYFAISGSLAPDLWKAVRKDFDQSTEARDVIATPTTTAAATAPTTGPAVAADDDAGPNTDNAEDERPTPGRLLLALVVVAGLAIGLALAAPVFVGISSPIFGLIMLFALYEAWKMNKRTVVAFNGPFSLGGAGPAGFPTAPPPIPPAIPGGGR